MTGPNAAPASPKQRSDPMAKGQDDEIEVFMPPNVLKAKVGNFSGVDMSAIKRAETAMESLKENFAAWAEDDVRRLGEARALFAKKPDATSRAALLRAAHDMKGQAGTFDFPLIARVAGSLAYLIHDLPEGTELSLTLVDAHVNAIQIIHRQNMRDMSDPVAVTLTKELEARVKELMG
jgi:chemotaxis protein histidine kinase CheA